MSPVIDMLCLLAMGSPTDGWNDWAGQCWAAFSWDITADASTTNAINPPITSIFDFYITLTAELADDISLRHIVLTFNFIKFTNPNPNPTPNPNPNQCSEICEHPALSYSHTHTNTTR